MTDTALPSFFIDLIGATESSVSDDLQLIMRWTETYESYRSKECAKKEGLRLALWLGAQQRQLRDLNVEDVMPFKKFLLDPKPKALWIGKKTSITNTEQWRPFTGPLIESSARTSFAYLRSLFNFLKVLEITTENPFVSAKVRFKNSDCKSFQKKIFSTKARETIGGFFSKNPYELDQADLSRRRLLFLFAFHTGARRTEISEAKLSDFHQDTNGLYWWRVVGKGRKYDEVPVSEQLLELLEHEVQERGINLKIGRLPPIPLITTVQNPLKPLSPHRVWSLFKNTSALIANYCDSLNDPETAEEVRSASTHWLRHSAGSFQLSELGLTLSEVRDNLRHASIATTSLYLDTEDRIRHDKVAKAKF